MNSEKKFLLIFIIVFILLFFSVFIENSPYSLNIKFEGLSGASTGNDLKFSTLSGIDSEDIETYVVPTMTNNKILPNSSIDLEYLSNNISIYAAPGEFEPASFVIVSENNLSNIHIQTSNLTKGSNRINRSNIDITVVKVWYQAGIDHFTPYYTKSFKVMTPELLLKDDSLVKVENGENYVKFTNGTYRWISNVSDDITLPQTVEEFPVRDSITLQPVNITANLNKQFWITVKIPENTSSGNYRSIINISNSSTVIEQINLNVRVLPFNLSNTSRLDSLYYYGQFNDNWPNGSISEYSRTEEQFKAEIKNMLEHGITNPALYQNYNLGQDNLGQALSIRNELGLGNKSLYYLGLRPWGNQSLDEVEEVINFTEDYDVGEVYFYGKDEAKGDELTAQRALWQDIHNLGGKIFVACCCDAYDSVGDLLDLAIYSGYPSSEEASKWHSQNNEIACYANPQVGVEEPETYRRNFGLLLWQNEYNGGFDFAYQYAMNHMWNDFDTTRHRDEVFTYITLDGVIDTIQWEGFREGIDDVKYIQTLINKIDELNGTVDVSSANEWVNHVKSKNLHTSDLSYIRSKTKDFILYLLSEGSEPGYCGDGTADSDEECDTDDFSGLSCNDFGYTGGNLYCTESCIIRTFNCTPSSLNISFDSQNITNNDWMYINASIEGDCESLSSFINWNNSLVGYWDFNEGSGTDLYDKSGNNQNGYFVGNLTWTKGKFGDAIYFNNSEDHIRIDNPDYIDGLDAITIEAWLYQDGGDDDQGIMSDDWFILRDSGWATFYLYNSTVDSSGYIGQFHLQPYKWHHLVATYDKDLTGDNMRVYVDGILQSSKRFTGSIREGNGPLRINIQSGSSDYWKGMMDEIKIWNRALSEQEIKASYDSCNNNPYANFTDLDEGNYSYSIYSTDKSGKNKTKNYNLEIDYNRFYVSPSGNDSNSGTSPSEPWETVQHAMDSLRAGDTVYIMEGVYTGLNTPWSGASSGTADEWITYTNYPGDEAIIEGPSTGSAWNGIMWFDSQNYIRISNLTFRRAPSHAILFGNAADMASNLRVDNCIFHNTSSSAISVQGSTGKLSGVIIENNTVYDTRAGWNPNGVSQESITLSNVENFIVRNNYMYDNHQISIDAKSGSRNGKIYDNWINTTSWTCEPAYGTSGIYIDGQNTYCQNISIYNNFVVGNGTGYATSTEQGGNLTNIRVYNNIYSGTGNGYQINDHTSVNGSHLKKNSRFINNLCGLETTICFQLTDNTSSFENFTIRNNIIAGGIGINAPKLNLSLHNVDHNLFNFSSYTDYYGTNYVEGNPLFIDSENYNFSLQQGSPAIDSGSSLNAPLLDYRGFERPQGNAPDIGAFESPYTRTTLLSNETIITNHTSVEQFENIPNYWLEKAKNLTVHYAHTSHGSQINSGLNWIESNIDSVNYSVAIRQSTTEGLPSEEDPPALRIYDGNPPETYIMPNDYWDNQSSANALNRTEEVVKTGNYSISLWSWCGQQSSNSEDTVQRYLDNMKYLQEKYPNVTFVLMTGHLGSQNNEYVYSNSTRETLKRNNDLVRNFTRDNNMTLFDFADIEAYVNGTDPMCTTNDYHDYYKGYAVECEWPSGGPSCAHTVGYNCIQKGKAFWWMMARLAGWNGTSNSGDNPEVNNTYYVDATLGNDSWGGNVSDGDFNPDGCEDDLDTSDCTNGPWQTIGKVNTEMNGGVIQQGDDIYFKRGNEFSNTNLNILLGGNSSNLMTIGDYSSGNKPVFSNNQIIVQSEGTDYINIQNINISNPSGNGVTVNLVNHTNITISNLYISGDTGWNGIFIDHTVNYIIENCVIHNIRKSGIVLYGDEYNRLSNGIIRNNTVYNCMYEQSDCFTIHRDGSNNNAGSNHLFINNNGWDCYEEVFDLTAGEKVILKDSSAIDLEGSSQDENGISIGHNIDKLLIDNFTSYDNEGESLIVTEGTNIIIRNSVLYNNKENHLVDIDNTGSDGIDDLKMYHNTFIHGEDSVTEQMFDIKYVIFSNTDFKNNIIMSSEPTSPLRLFRLLQGNISALVSVANFTSNIWWRSHEPTGLRWQHFNGGSAQSILFSTWKSYYPTENVSDPLLNNISNKNFTLSNESPAIDAGDFLTETIGSGTGTTITVHDSGYFCDGYEMINGDVIRVGSDRVMIIDVNYTTNTLIVNESISWNDGESVSLNYQGNAPDIGAIESPYSSVSYNPEVSGTFYVSNEGNDNWGGNVSDGDFNPDGCEDDLDTSDCTNGPWQTISKLSDALRYGPIEQGDDIYFKRGDTFSDYPVQVRTGGSSSNEMIFGAYGSGDKPIIGRHMPSYYHGFQGLTSGIGYITIQDIDLNGVDKGIDFTQLQNHDITVRNVDITDADGVGIVFREVNYFTIENCHIYPNNSGVHAISIVGDENIFGANGIIRNCTCHGCKDGINIHYAGSDEAYSVGDNIWIDDCIIYDTDEEGIDTVGGSYADYIYINNTDFGKNCSGAFTPSHAQSHIIVDNCYIHDGPGNLITTGASYQTNTAVNYVIIRNSIIKGWTNHAFAKSNGGITTPSRNLTIYNNDFIANDSVTDFIKLTPYVKNIIFKNNIFYSGLYSSPNTFVSYQNGATLSGTSSIWSHNLWWRGDGGLTEDEWWYDGDGSYNFTEWLAEPEISGDLRQDPSLVDPDGSNYPSDFALNNDSPAINAGDWLTYTNGSGSGATVTVEEANYFFKGFVDMGAEDYKMNLSGDIVFIGDDSHLEVLDVDYDAETITVNQSITWEDGDPVSLAYSGSAPDIGAFEYTNESQSSNTAPTILSVSPENNSAEVSVNNTSFTVDISDENNDLLDWTINVIGVGSCLGIDEEEGLKTCTLSDLNYNNPYTWYVYVSDGEENINESYYFTTEEESIDDINDDDEVPTGGSSGGSGGNLPASDSGISKTQLFNELVDYDDSHMNINSNKIPISKLSLRSKKSVLKNVEVTVTTHNEKPVSVPETNTNTYRYLSIDCSNNNVLGKIYFRVNKSWINENNIDPNKVYLLRYKDVWERLKTERSGESKNHIGYYSENEGFSQFAISGDKKEDNEVIFDENKSEKLINKSPITNESKEITISEKAEFKYYVIIIPLLFIGLISIIFVGIKKTSTYVNASALRKLRIIIFKIKIRIIFKDISNAKELYMEGWEIFEHLHYEDKKLIYKELNDIWKIIKNYK